MGSFLFNFLTRRGCCSLTHEGAGKTSNSLRLGLTGELTLSAVGKSLYDSNRNKQQEELNIMMNSLNVHS